MFSTRYVYANKLQGPFLYSEEVADLIQLFLEKVLTSINMLNYTKSKALSVLENIYSN